MTRWTHRTIATSYRIISEDPPEEAEDELLLLLQLLIGRRLQLTHQAGAAAQPAGRGEVGQGGIL